ncbi:phage major capsid protein [Pseudoalteromonas galatheae]|uniref:phage major capsid protein n=1 Tax=Pseudoalteromonas galatheae TaxID=579562 RepID=UPI0030CE66DA
MLTLLPTGTGFLGNRAFVEAKSSDYHDVMTLVTAELRKLLATNSRDSWVDITAFYADKVVVRKDGRYWAYPYAVSELNQVTFENAIEVVKEYKPSDVVKLTEAWYDETKFIEASNVKPSKFLVTLIEVGKSLNGVDYPAHVLREAAPLFNGAKCMVKSDDDHLKGTAQHFNNLIGQFSNAQFVEGVGAGKKGALQADLTVLESSGYATKLREAVDNNMQDLFGLSIDVDGTASGKKGSRTAKKFLKVNSVDLIMVPGAGGRIVSFKEAHNQGNVMNEQLMRLLEALKKSNPQLAASVTAEDDETAIVQLTEALAKHGAPDAGQGTGLTLADVNKVIADSQRLVEAKQSAVALINKSTLPDAAKTRLVESVQSSEDVSTDKVQKLIDSEISYLSKFTESGKVNMPEGAQYSDNPSGVELLTALFDPANKDVVSLKEAYIDLTGDKHCTGRLNDCSRTRMVEALDSDSLPNVLADVINRRVVDVYGGLDKYQLWRKVFRIGTATDFKDQNVTEWGGYGDLQEVLESGAYPELAKPTDSNAKYRVSKKGGIATITMEMIKNDDRNIITQIPNKLARAAARTLSKFAWDFYLNNRNAPDGKALFHADHNNLFSAALSQEELMVHWRAIMNQQELDTGEMLEIEPAFLLCSLGNVDAAFDLFQRLQNNDKGFAQQLNLEILRVPGATDPNDWGLMTDPSELANFEMGFLDGMENPEIFTQDMQNVGTVFTNDQTTMKIRHIYGGQCTDYRGATKALVL